MMKQFVSIMILAMLTVSVSSCGLRGSLKSPAQIAYQEEKEARRAERKAGKKPIYPVNTPLELEDEGVATPDHPEPGALQYNDILAPGAHPNQPSTHGTYQ